MGEPVKIQILYGERFARVAPGIFRRLGCAGKRLGSARRTAQLKRLGSARLKYGARVAQSSSTSGRVGEQCRIFRRRVWLSRRLPLGAWANNAESLGGACGSPRAPIRLILAPMSSYGWALHCGMIKTYFLTTLKIQVYHKILLFSDERGSDTNC